jgi:putative FmdB family regulatory protein
MPIYIYRCENCGVQFERQQKFSDPPLTRCPECEKKTLRKVYQPVGIVFKGSGFYSTDHRSPSGNSRHGDKVKSDEKESVSGESASGEGASGEKTSADKAPAKSSPQTGGSEQGRDSGSNSSDSRVASEGKD